MAKKQSPTFVLTQELKEHALLFSVIEKELEICRVMYNAVLGNYLKLEKQMKREKQFQRLMRQYKGVQKKLEKDTKNKQLTEEKRVLQQAFKLLRDQYELNEYASHHWVKPIRKHFGNQVNSAVAQKVASRAWEAFEKKLFGQAKRVFFVRKGDFSSFESKTNTTGWRFVDGFIVYKNIYTRLKTKKKDTYANEILRNIQQKTEFTYSATNKGKTTLVKDTYRVKYVRIVKKTIRGKRRYFANLVIAGYPSFKERKIGKGDVGLDIGTSTVAVSSLKKVALFNLAEPVKHLAREIRLLQRKMDRSKRSTNPAHFLENGTIKKGKKTWTYSKRYQRLKAKLTELHRKQSDIRKWSHRTLANSLLEIGDTFYCETMNFKALQKRKKETEISEKTGKIKRKKRFGKTLGHRAPSMFLNILEEKVKRYNGCFRKVNTYTFKASQYCHIRNEYIKKPLSQRWHIAGEEIKVQRDLYSAFLLMNADDAGQQANRERCNITFEQFKTQHDQFIKTILSQKKLILNSGIVFST
ncbi:RNA-guided endonuclease TnpB family protein [Priestia aryabhattai]|uniref:RNA-guided endonuclease TnpB family protein n=1 Tax=Priestia aryabhattai TaxID=412384 RepID=UPI0039A1BE5C